MTMVSAAAPRPVTIAVDDTQSVSGLLCLPGDARACYVLAHGAGAGMHHPFMAAVADGLAGHRIATLRYQFPYMERGSKRPDLPKVAHAAVHAAVAEAALLCPGLALIAGGKSFGGRMTSQAQASAPLPGVVGIAFLGFPLHRAGDPSEERAKHLAEVMLPMLFLQGTRDELADATLVQALAARLGERATLKMVDGADHSFHVLARSGRNDVQVLAELLDTLAAWLAKVIER
jgi:predicted alpha/beta-hydrolase family hydrolase